MAAQQPRQFADQTAWQRHREHLGLTDLQVTPDPVRVATEGALWGAVAEHGSLQEAVIGSGKNLGQLACAWLVGLADASPQR